MKKQKRELIKYLDLKVGMRVKDANGNIGTITKCVDVKSVTVKFETGNGGYGFYHFDPTSPTLYKAENEYF